MPKGQGQCSGAGAEMGRGAGRSGGKSGTGGNRRAGGAVGSCICRNCGEQTPHQQGVPCYSVNCPKCGVKMMRA